MFALPRPHHRVSTNARMTPGAHCGFELIICWIKLDASPDHRWVLITEGTDFSGTAELEATKDSMSTRQLLTWVLERDDEIRDASFVQVDEPDESIEEQHKRAFGPYGAYTREAAKTQ